MALASLAAALPLAFFLFLSCDFLSSRLPLFLFLELRLLSVPQLSSQLFLRRLPPREGARTAPMQLQEGELQGCAAFALRRRSTLLRRCSFVVNEAGVARASDREKRHRCFELRRRSTLLRRPSPREGSLSSLLQPEASLLSRPAGSEIFSMLLVLLALASKLST